MWQKVTHHRCLEIIRSHSILLSYNLEILRSTAFLLPTGLYNVWISRQWMILLEESNRPHSREPPHGTRKIIAREHNDMDFRMERLNSLVITSPF